MASAPPAPPVAPSRPAKRETPIVVLPLAGLAVLAVGMLALYVPTFYDMSRTLWQSDGQSHGPIILGMAIWLLWRDREAIYSGKSSPALFSGLFLLVSGVAFYVLGRSQAVITFEVGSLVLLLGACLLLQGGWSALKVAWFPLFFLLFMIPLPDALVANLTVPLKSAVSTVAEYVLFKAGYPIGRSGVILSIGPYQLMVADACAGLHSMFTLESLGLLYMKLMDYRSPTRNVLLAMLILPVSFISNVVRVIVLVLVTYYFGDEAGQGFTHWFAGMVLFAVALVGIFLLDRVLSLFFKETPRAS